MNLPPDLFIIGVLLKSALLEGAPRTATINSSLVEAKPPRPLLLIIPVLLRLFPVLEGLLPVWKILI